MFFKILWIVSSLLLLPKGDFICNWTTIDKAEGIKSGSHLALGKNDLPNMVYKGHKNASLKLSRCHDLNCRNKTLIPIDGTSIDGGSPFLALDKLDLAVMIYYDESERSLKFIHCHDFFCKEKTSRVIDFQGSSETFLVLDHNDLPVIAYFDRVKSALNIVRCHDLDCIDATLESITKPKLMGQDISLVLDQNSFPVIVFHDLTDAFFDLTLARCHDLFCKEFTLQPIDNDGWVGGYTSLALDSNDFPVISYHDESNSRLKLALCHDLFCNKVSTLIPDHRGTVGLYTSLVLKNDIISIIYLDSTHERLKLAQYDYPKCPEVYRYIIDAQGGYDTSLVSDKAGNLVMSYYDKKQEKLKITRCRLAEDDAAS